MAGEYGVQETKDMLKFLIELAEGIDRSDADGRFDMADLANMIGALAAAGPAFTGAMNIPKEMADLSDEEAKELVDFIDADLQLGHDKTLELVKKALNVGLGLYELISMVRK